MGYLCLPCAVDVHQRAHMTLANGVTCTLVGEVGLHRLLLWQDRILPCRQCDQSDVIQLLYLFANVWNSLDGHLGW